MSENFTFWRKQKRKIKYCNHNIGKIVKLKVHNDFLDFGWTNNIFVDCTWMFYQKYWNVLFNPRNSHFNSNSIKLSKEWSKERATKREWKRERENELKKVIENDLVRFLCNFYRLFSRPLLFRYPTTFPLQVYISKLKWFIVELIE